MIPLLAFNSSRFIRMKIMLLTFVLALVTKEYNAAPPLFTDEETFTSSEYYSSLEMDSTLPTPPPPAVQLDFVYHNYVALTEFLHNVSTHYPALTHLYSIGQSVLSKLLFFGFK